ncbi:hypothetical protein JCM1841_005807 [Sporobolomyces salmonicolor]
MQWPSPLSSSSQPLQTLTPQPHPFLSPSPSHGHSLQPSTSTSTSSHRVPFGSIPGSHPGVLGWGVGMSAANGGGFGFAHRAGAGSPFGAQGARMTPPPQAAPTVGWGSATAAAGAGGAPSSPSSAFTANSRRRRRSATPDSSDDDGDHRSNPLSSASRPVRPLQHGGILSAKRARTVGGDAAGLASGLAGGLSLAGAAASGGPGGNVGDLGKALASLDKPALLTVLSSLLQSHPHLAATISTLLPAPSLSTTLSTLSSLERGVLSAIPTGLMRPEYVWSRVRVPLEEFISESRRYLSAFVPAQAPPAASNSTEDDLHHPTTTITFLLSLTASLVHLEASLPPSSADSPSPLAAHLLPLVINAFHVFLTRLSTAVNHQGRVLAMSTVRGWFEKVDELCSPLFGGRFAGAPGLEAGRDSQVRRAMEGVRDRMRREVGWLVGFKPEVHSGAGSGMEGVEEEEL